MPEVAKCADGRAIVKFAANEVKEINDTWIDELIEEAMGERRSWKPMVGVWVVVDTWVEPQGRTFDV